MTAASSSGSKATPFSAASGLKKQIKLPNQILKTTFYYFTTSIILNSIACVGVTQKAYAQSDTAAKNQPLRDGQYLRSKNGLFVAVMQGDGNFVVYRGTSPNDQHGHLWAHDHNVGGCPCFAVVQGDGNFVVYHGTGQNNQHDVIWASNKYSDSYSGPYVGIMQDDGNFVVYHGRSNDDRRDVQWATNQTDSVQSYDSLNAFNYDLSKGHINKISNIQILRQDVSNNTDFQSTSTISGSLQTSEASSWADTITKTYGIKGTSELTLPIVGGKQTIEISYEYQNTHMDGGSSTATTQWQYTSQVVLPPHTSGTLTGMATVADIVVPYTLTGTVVFQSGTRMPATVSGMYTGTNSYDVHVDAEGVSRTTNAAPRSFKLTLLHNARPVQPDKRPPAIIKMTPTTDRTFPLTISLPVQIR